MGTLKYYNENTSQWEYAVIGKQGVQGLTGIQGSSGAQGVEGAQGITGSQGITGIQGHTGIQGIQGEIGLQGITGSQGITGIQGNIGIQGTEGAQGIQGIQGHDGTQGITGTQGLTGVQGDQGLQGIQGEQGTQGIQGSTGIQGDVGLQGIQGIQGEQGIQGVQGLTGNFGGETYDFYYDTDTTESDPGSGYIRLNNTLTTATELYIDDIDANNDNVSQALETIDDSTSTVKGTFRLSDHGNTGNYVFYQIVGPHIDNGTWYTVPVAYVSGTVSSFTDNTLCAMTLARVGDKGDTGAQGTTGSQGIQGEQGLQGLEGIQGTTGIQGSDGIQGSTGETGAQGTQGIQGHDGIQGVEGIQGHTGAQGTNGIQGEQGIQGETGIQGAQGLLGTQGEVGPQGTIGAQGETGTQGFVGIQGDLGPQGIQGVQGPQGLTGTQGLTGAGIQGPEGPAGTGVVFQASAPIDTDVIWVDTDENQNAFIPAGGTTGQAIVKNSNTDYDYGWGTVVTPSNTVTLTNKTLTSPVIGTDLTLNSAGGVQIFKINNDSNGNFEVGRIDGVSSTPYIDFHSGATAADFDTRIIASGGTGSNGGGSLNIFSSALSLNSVAIPTISSTSTLTNKTLTSPAITSPVITGTSQVWQMLENATVSATAATGTINYDLLSNGAVTYYTSNASGNWTLNVRGNSTTQLNSVMSVGQSLTMAFLVTNGATPYYQSAFQVDGSSVTPKWQNGTAISSGNANSIDIYAITIVKTANATFTAFIGRTRFA